MQLFTTISLCIALSSAAAIVSYQLQVRQTSMFIFASAMLLGCLAMVLQTLFPSIALTIADAFAYAHPSAFPDMVTEGLLSYLLFAGCLHIDAKTFKQALSPILSLAFTSTFIAIVLHGIGFYYLAQIVGVSLSWLDAMLLSTAVSPTDPVAVLALLKKVPAPKKISTLIAGESLLNDGVALAVFTLLKQFTHIGNVMPSAWPVAYEILREFTGCLLQAYILYKLLRTLLRLGRGLDHESLKYHVTVTFLLIHVNYLSARYFHLSPALCIVVFGLLSSSSLHTIQTNVKTTLLVLWDTIDEMLNAVLFFIVGVEIIFISAVPWSVLFITGVLAIVMFARLLSVNTALVFSQRLSPYTRSIVSLGGIKGALSVAMALTLTHLPADTFHFCAAVAYLTVAFTIIVQGNVLEAVLKRLYLTTQRNV